MSHGHQLDATPCNDVSRLRRGGSIVNSTACGMSFSARPQSHSMPSEVCSPQPAGRYESRACIKQAERRCLYPEDDVGANKVYVFDTMIGSVYCRAGQCVGRTNWICGMAFNTSKEDPEVHAEFT